MWEIRKLEEHNKVDYERIKIVLDWYSDNVGGEFIPVIESGYSLRMKFSRLEDSMKREQDPAHKNKKTVIRNGQSYHPDSEGLLRNAAGERLIE